MTPADARWRPDRALVRAAQPLLDQQLFCLGEDIKHPDGNLLCALGFVRERDVSGTVSHYRRMDDGGVVLQVWGFGLFYSQPEMGGLFLERTRFAPRLAAPEPPCIWDRRQLGDRAARTTEDGERLRRLCRNAFLALADYEEAVLARVGLPWRAGCVARWFKTRLPAATMATSWRTLADRCIALADVS
jgi:hypothetical protein